ncbi:uncharacterized protein [Glycine max]|uniref:uncharacterized protein n=1 Tax=Glycine max TaxID=3847 RepID=UPI0003DEB4EE|nr:uncharacterized protein LOC102667815 [Glycine max]|eukprot:XP_006582509.1 uncharacterized protein LOC102667815 [Glycine max]
MTPKIATSVIWLTQASYVWNALRNWFSQGNYIRILQLHSDLYSLKQVVAKQKYRDIDSVLCFLQVLNDLYNQARSQILMLDPLPSLDKVFSIIIQQERHMNLAILPTPTVVLVVQPAPSFTTASPGRGRGYSKQGQSRHCTHCGKNNHTVDTCFAKHGYPPGWKSKKAFVNQIFAFASSSEELNSSTISEAFSGLSKDQLANLIALLPNAKPTATAVSSTNLVSSHNIFVQPSSDEYMSEDDWYS